jgi:hypothetical protein
VSAAVAAGTYATFSITPSAGNKLSCSAISRYDYRRSSTGPTNGVWQYAVGNGAFVSFATNAYPVSSSGGASLAAIDLSGIAVLQNVAPGTTVTFRLVNFGGSSPSGTWYVFDYANSTALDLMVDGSVTPLTGPPASVPVLTSALVTNGQFQFTLNGTTGSNYVVEASTNLAAGSWTPVQTGAAPILFLQPATNNWQFYRGNVR